MNKSKKFSKKLALRFYNNKEPYNGKIDIIYIGKYRDKRLGAKPGSKDIEY